MYVQYRFVHALSDKDLMKKLLALDLRATTTKMWKSARLTLLSATTWMHWALLALSPSMLFIKGSTTSNINMEQSNLGPNTNVGITWTIIMSSQELNLQQVWKGLTLEAKMSWRSTKGTTTQQRRKEREK